MSRRSLHPDAREPSFESFETFESTSATAAVSGHRGNFARRECTGDDSRPADGSERTLGCCRAVAVAAAALAVRPRRSTSLSLCHRSYRRCRHPWTFGRFPHRSYCFAVSYRHRSIRFGRRPSCSLAPVFFLATVSHSPSPFIEHRIDWVFADPMVVRGSSRTGSGRHYSVCIIAARRRARRDVARLLRSHVSETSSRTARARGREIYRRSELWRLAEARASSLHRRSGHRNFLARFLERARARRPSCLWRASASSFCPAIQPAGRRPQWVEPSVVIARRPRGID